MWRMADSTSLSVKVYPRIAEIGQAVWEACASTDNPFLSYGFLSALEDSGSVGGRSGWHPRYAALVDEAGEVVAVAPSYAKTHSQGEYVFDQSWANAFEQAGGRYYPKLQIAAPFSPVPGPRLLRRPGVSVAAMAQALEALAEELGCSSTHVTFCTEEEWRGLGAAGWLQRMGMQYHWENQGYAHFDGFLEALSSRKRKAIKRERREAQEGLSFRALSGADLTPEVWRQFYRFYTATTDRKWGGAYLTPEFFPLLGERLGENVVLMFAYRDGQPIAGALNLRSETVLYGRNWGCVEDVPFLHFELCYYQAIDYAIAHGLKRVEAGAQGEHKVQRGYLPQPTYSAHFIRHPGLRNAVAAFVEAEAAQLQELMAEMRDEGPYRKEG
jgi:uncharacterized protein